MAHPAGIHLREHGHAAATDAALALAFTQLRAGQVTTKAACALIGRPRASHYRHRGGPVHGPKQARRRPDNGQGLSAAKQTAVLTLINSKEYADLAIGQIWTRELDEGRYLCSMSSMYRIARAAGQTRERRRQATHPAKVKPELMADAPSQIWSWDIERHEAPFDRAVMKGHRPRSVAAGWVKLRAAVRREVARDE